jgi:molecular chaperone DnaK
MAKIVPGIDLGTTFSAVAYVDDQGRPHIIPNADGKTTTPSAVLIQDGRITVGDVALNQWVTNEEHVVRWIKRAMGNEQYRFQELSAVQISAEILKTLKADAELCLGEPLEEAVITCPAYFAALEIENTKRAGELAGFQVREIVKEPTAAAVYYGVEQMRDGETILVCDLGGGTYDATILTVEHGVFMPRATMGDRQLGGHDWTMELVELVAERFQERFGADPRNDLVAGQMLYEACEQAKRDLARVTAVTIPCHFQGRMEQIVVPQEAFEARAEWRIQALVTWSERALEKAGLAWSDLARILLVGGSSRLRRMGLALEERSRIRPTQIREPDLAVALGAAILARGQVRPRRPMAGLVEASRSGLIEVNYKRIIARSLGTRVIMFDGDRPRITTSLLIPHSTESPVSRSRDDYAVLANGQQVFDVPVVEFESDEDYDVVGNFRFTCLPNAKCGNRIKVTFHYDVSGIVTVEALDLQSGQSLPGERLPYQEPNLEEVMRIRVKPRWVVFAVDVSYSMQGAKMTNAKQALIATARELLAIGGEQCKIGIVSFASSASIVARPTSDLAALERVVATLAPSGTTAMDAGIRQATELVLAAPAGTDRDVVMLTDGMPDDQRRQSTRAAAKESRRQGVTLSSLGIGAQDVDLNFLQSLTPLSLVIDAVDSMAEGMSTLLTQAAAARGGNLMDTATGGLSNVEGL